MKQYLCKVLRRDTFHGKFCLLVFENRFSNPVIPGQFVHIRVRGVFLRRPFSVACLDKNEVGILFRIKGTGTKLLSDTKTGELLDVIGPLGNGFPVDIKNRIVIVAGGIGIAPMLLAVAYLMRKNHDFSLLYGARNADELVDFLLPEGNYSKIITTDDGTAGIKGQITEQLGNNIYRQKNVTVFAAGPYPMLKTVAAMCREAGVPAYVSVETRMFCGLGICQGCVIHTKKGNLKICSDGPVFNSDHIIWDEQAPV
jgi:dihydroorotate dehydrogenase electron transfer subunit